ncbi:hypothetical protein T06_9983 [Trichinella sp. T6]|nr:hypothetical protein T06_9983 [Trichinella sp. T6]
MTLSIVCLVVVSPNELVCICGDVDDLLIRRISFVNNGWRELKETIGQLKILHLPITFGVSEKRLRVQMLDKMRRDTTRQVKSRNSKQQIHRKHFLLKNKDNKHVNGGSSECTVILSVMYHSNVSGRSTDLRALLIASFIGRVSFVNNGWRELKETPSSNWKIPCQAIMFGVKSRNSKQQIHRKYCLLEN